MTSIEALEGECNELGMEILNILEYISESVDYQKITQLVQKLSHSVDSIVKGIERLKNIEVEDLETQVGERKVILQRLTEQLEKYQIKLGSWLFISKSVYTSMG